MIAATAPNAVVFFQENADHVCDLRHCRGCDGKVPLEEWHDHMAQCPRHDKLARGICVHSFSCGNQGQRELLVTARCTKVSLRTTPQEDDDIVF